MSLITSADRFRWYRTWFGKAMIVGGVLIVAGSLLACYLEGNRRQRCDRSAEADMSKLGACLERLQDELQDLNCPEVITGLTEDHLKYLVGGFYGWSGTNRRCVVCVRMKGKEIWGCAKGGTAQGGTRTGRTNYRVSTLEPSRTLPPTTEECKGRAYPDPTTTGPMTYHESMIDDSCRHKEPQGLPGVDRLPPTGGGRPY